ncbi:MAG: hypothetical protein ACXAC2_05755, partial [Candidatus Kariarchaeaceae archaeon]
IIIVGTLLFQLMYLILIFVGFALGFQMFITGWKEYSPGVSNKLKITKPGRFIGLVSIGISIINSLGVIIF